MTISINFINFSKIFLGDLMKKFIAILALMASLSAMSKTYVLTSEQDSCDQTLEITAEAQLSYYQKKLEVRFLGEEEIKIFLLKGISQYYDSAWLDYATSNGEKLQYFWDDGYGIIEGFRYLDCIYYL